MKIYYPKHMIRITRLWVSLVSILLAYPCFSQTTPDGTAEAENGILAGGTKIANTIQGYSGTGYVTNFTSTADKVTVTIKVPAKGFYKLMIRYFSDYKIQDLYVNGKGPSPVAFPKTTSFTEVDAGNFLLNPGDNSFTIQSNWGWINIDKFSLYSVPPHTYTITPLLVNPNANEAARALYSYLLSAFGSKIISGQTDSYYDVIKPIANNSPMVRTFDFQHYTQGYSYLWNNGGFSFGWEDNGQTQKAIDWYNETGKRGIVSFQWHWHSPGGGIVGTNTFYTNSTTFDVTRAVQAGTQENKDIIRDIDSIASQLKKLQKANVPVLWRPLHEAGGGWFWWGAKGPDACKKLFGIMFERLTHYHGLNNLIWVWSTPETEWYPGNDSIDIAGYDSYPGAYNYDPQKSAFDKLFNLTEGKKLIAMSENGPIPDPDDCLTNDCPWSYFMSWSDLVTSQNSAQHIFDVFNNSRVLTLENNVLGYSMTPSTIKETTYKLYPNPSNDCMNIVGPVFKRIELIDLYGRVIYASNSPLSTIQKPQPAGGIYILRITNNKEVFQQKIVFQ